MDRPPLLEDDPSALDALSRVEVLYSDLDGTLLAPGGSVLANAEGSPSTSTVDAIVALNRAGLTVVPVSGRTRLQLTEITRLLGWSDFIAELGAVLARGVGAGRHVTYNTLGWPEQWLADGATPYEIITDSGALAALQSAFPGRIEYHAPWHCDREASHLLRGCIDQAEAQAVLDSIDLPVSLLDNGRVRPPVHGLTCDAVHAYHLVPRGVSKTQAIALDLAERGLSANQAAAIGDSVTDLAMVDGVALMALVDNAFESESVLQELAEKPRGNVVRLSGARGDGWAQFARAWLAARDSRI